MKYISKLIVLTISIMLISNAMGVGERPELSVNDSLSASSPTATIVNPWYAQRTAGASYEVAPNVTVKNGSILLYSANGVIGDAIRAACTDNSTPNPYGFSHAGLVIVDNPRVLYNLALRKLHKEQATANEVEQATQVLEELEKYCSIILDAKDDPGMLCAFSVEFTGTAGEVLSGELPGFRFLYLPRTILEYDGNVFLRPLTIDMPQEHTRNFIDRNLGRSYTSLLDPSSLLLAPEHENTSIDSRRFCSEAVACFFHKTEHISTIPSNVLPEDLCSCAESGDVVAAFAGKEIPLKITRIDTYKDTGDKKDLGCCTKQCCCSYLCKGFLSLFGRCCKPKS